MTVKNKRYFWIQLAQDFFKSKEMKLLRKIAGGDTHTIIYLKMMLMSLEDSGRIYFDGIADNLAEEIALVIDESVEDIKITLIFLESKGLLTRNSEREYFLEQVPEMIGSETASTRRSRKHRELKMSQGNTTATNGNGEIETEEDKREIESKRENEEFHFPTWLNDESIEIVKKGNPENYHFRIPIAYLNQVLQKRKPFLYVDSNIKPIKARFNEGHKLDDFKYVVDVKVAEWLKNPKMAKFLKPDTLFGTKFNNYISQDMPGGFQPDNQKPDERLGF